jgi:hypothetical protein
MAIALFGTAQFEIFITDDRSALPRGFARKQLSWTFMLPWGKQQGKKSASTANTPFRHGHLFHALIVGRTNTLSMLSQDTLQFCATLANFFPPHGHPNALSKLKAAIGSATTIGAARTFNSISYYGLKPLKRMQLAALIRVPVAYIDYFR